MDKIKNINNVIEKLNKLTVQERSQVLARLQDDKNNDAAYLNNDKFIIKRVSSSKPIASFWQEQMWYLEQLSPDLPTYNVPFRFNLKGPLDVDALNKSLEEIERRHESLRTNIKQKNGKIYQDISSVRFSGLSMTDLSKENDIKKAADDFSQIFMKTSFTLSEGPLYRVHLLKLDKLGHDHVLLWVGSHAIADGWSLSIIIQELIALYGSFLRKDKTELKDLPIQFGDFANWQREKLSGPSYQKILEYWKTQLEGCEPLNVETDFKRPDIQSMNGDTYLFSINKDKADQIESISRHYGVTPFNILLTAYQLLLVNRTGQEECVIGTGVNGRTKSELESLIGSFVNIVVIRTHMSDNPTFIELVKRVRQVTLEAFSNQDLPFGKLIQELAIPRDHSRPPLCQTIFIYGSTPLLDNNIKLSSDLDLSWNGISTHTVKFDFELAIDEQPNGLLGRFDYCTDIFCRETAEELCTEYLRIVDLIIEDPERDLLEIFNDIGIGLYKKRVGSKQNSYLKQNDLLVDNFRSQKLSDIESEIADIWTRALDVKHINRKDEFFAVGGHSVMAAQIVMQLSELFDINLTLQDFLKNSTISSLATVIEKSLTNDTIEILNRIEELSEKEVNELLNE